MKQNEFLAELKIALENELNEQDVKENLEFYRSYVQTEIQKGIPEEEVIAQLGDPWAIAKTVILTEKIEDKDSGSESEVQGNEQKSYDNGLQEIPKWKLVLIIIAVMAVLLLVGSMAFGVIAIVLRLAMRLALPILVFWLVIKLMSRK